MGVIAGETETESGHALAVLVFGGNEDEIRATRFFVPTLRGRAAGVAAEVAAAVRPKLGKSNLLIFFADTYNFEAEATLEALGTELPGVTIAGGGASEDASGASIIALAIGVGRESFTTKSVAITAAGIPIAAPMATDRKPAESEIRVPDKIRLKMSRPNESTPNQCAADGPAFSAS